MYSSLYIKSSRSVCKPPHTGSSRMHFFFYNDTAPTEIYTLSLPDALPISARLAPAYDRFFTHDSSSLDTYARAGARAHYLAFGCDPAYHRPIAAGAHWRSPLVFVGSRRPARERAVRALADLGIKVWGPGWPAGPVYGEAFVRALSGGT